MKVGSLVEFIGPESLPNPAIGLTHPPKKGDRVHIREIYTCAITGQPGCFFEEYVIGLNEYAEMGCALIYLRELLPPEEIAEALEEVNEVLKEQELEPCR